MRHIFSILIFLSLSNQSIGQGFNLVNTTWKYYKLMIKQQTDSLNLFHKDSTTNIYGLQKIRITFQNNDTYEALFFNGSKKQGFWKIENQKLIIDSDTNAIITQSNLHLTTKGEIQFSDLGYNINGTLITDLLKIQDCSILETLKSGDWNDPSVWSCDRVPNSNDNVIIHTGHTINLLKPMGKHNCKNLKVETGAIFINAGEVFLAKPD